MKGWSDVYSCIVDGIILCVRDIYVGATGCLNTILQFCFEVLIIHILVKIFWRYPNHGQRFNQNNSLNCRGSVFEARSWIPEINLVLWV
jgi:hypothetical protein